MAKADGAAMAHREDRQPLDGADQAFAWLANPAIIIGLITAYLIGHFALRLMLSPTLGLDDARFKRISSRKTGFVSLDRLLARLLDRMNDLLRVLDRPEIPLQTNGSENDIRCHVTKRKISGGTRSEAGRDARDTFLSLMKTCQKLGVSFFDYLGHRLNVQGAPTVPPLSDLVLAAKA